MANALLVPAFDLRAFKWAFRSGIAAGILTFLIFGVIIGTSPGLRVSLFFLFVLPVFLAAAAFYFTFALIFDKMRDMVIVRDLLIGRTFQARDVLSLVAKEEQIQKSAIHFRHLLELMRHWNKKMIVEITPDIEPTLRMIEAPHVK